MSKYKKGLCKYHWSCGMRLILETLNHKLLLLLSRVYFWSMIYSCPQIKPSGAKDRILPENYSLPDRWVVCVSAAWCRLSEIEMCLYWFRYNLNNIRRPISTTSPCILLSTRADWFNLMLVCCRCTQYAMVENPGLQAVVEAGSTIH